MSVPVDYRLGGAPHVVRPAGTAPRAMRPSLWMSFCPGGSHSSPLWQMQVSVRGRGGKVQTVLAETSALRPVANVTLADQSFPLAIAHHERRRGGSVLFGGRRKIDSDLLEWEMGWRPEGADPGLFRIDFRARLSTPSGDPVGRSRRRGTIRIGVPVLLCQPVLWELEPALRHAHCVQAVSSVQQQAAVGMIALNWESGWNESERAFEAVYNDYSLSGGRPVSFLISLQAGVGPESCREPMAPAYAAFAADALHAAPDLPSLHSTAAVGSFADPSRYHRRGLERLYLRITDEPDTFSAGHPHYPLDALKALWDAHRLNPRDDTPRLVRYAASAIAADFQVLGNGGDSEPNKGAFWDRQSGDVSCDYTGNFTHGIAANARMARGFFLLHEAAGEPILRQAALNICQWLLLKRNEEGYFDGSRVHATLGRDTDGKVIAGDGLAAGAEAIGCFVRAYRATKSEVFVKSAWRIADHLLECRQSCFADICAPDAARIVLALQSLEAEAPCARLGAAIALWGSVLRALDLSPACPALNADGRHSGLYECAEAGFRLYARLRDPAYLQFAYSALRSIPCGSRLSSWHEMTVEPMALIACAARLANAQVEFDEIRVKIDWRDFGPDPAGGAYVEVVSADGAPVHAMPLVCRGTDQLLLIVLAPSSVAEVEVKRHGRHPVLNDLLTGRLEEAACLHSIAPCIKARVGLFTIDP